MCARSWRPSFERLEEAGSLIEKCWSSTHQTTNLGTAFAGLKFLQNSQHHSMKRFIGVYGGYATRLLRLQRARGVRVLGADGCLSPLSSAGCGRHGEIKSEKRQSTCFTTRRKPNRLLVLMGAM